MASWPLVALVPLFFRPFHSLPSTASRPLPALMPTFSRAFHGFKAPASFDAHLLPCLPRLQGPCQL
eukprot:1152549-Pelagomonas_calceolata.AAC.4